jgi:SAM-dependent methyltransferase
MAIESVLTIQDLKASQTQLLKKLAETEARDLYRAALKVQMDVYAPALVDYFQGNSEWPSAKDVLDLGCGPGDLVAFLARRYPDKSYTGVDIDEYFMSIARQQLQPLGNCRLHHADVYEFAQGQYDFVVLKALLQHLKDPGRLMQRLPSLLRKDATVLISDASRGNFIDSDPPISAFEEFYRQGEVLQKEHSGDRDCLYQLEESLESYGFRLVESQELAIPVTTEEERVRAIQYIILGCTFALRMLPVQMELLDLFADLVRWHDAPAPRMKIKSRRMTLRLCAR